MTAHKKIFLVLLSSFFIVIVFVSGTYLGAYYNNIVLKFIPSPGSPQHYLLNLVAKNMPHQYISTLFYRGKLIDFSYDKIVLLDENNKTLTIPLNPELYKLISYYKRLDNKKLPESANILDFSKNASVYIIISSDLIKNKFYSIQFTIDYTKTTGSK